MVLRKIELHSLSKVIEFTRLDLNSVIVVNNVVAGLKTTVVEVLVLVNAWIVVVGERRAGNASAGVNAGHVVEEGVCNMAKEGDKLLPHGGVERVGDAHQR